MKQISKKRLLSNSMLATFKACRWKYWFSYMEGLSPAKEPIAPSRGNLFHELLSHLYGEGEDFDQDKVVTSWRERQIQKAQKHFDQTVQMYGIKDDHILTSAEERCDEMSKEILGIFEYYKENVYVHDQDEYDFLFLEQPFEVPIVDRMDRRHAWWRFGGKWDVVAKSKDSGRIFLWDHKLTVRNPAEFIANASLSTQPIAYTWAGMYLALQGQKTNMREFLRSRAVMPKGSACAVDIDGPKWPDNEPSPSGFALSVTRRKVPKKPTVVKKGDRLSKTSMKDTTAELLMEAILENNFDPNSYNDELTRLKKAGPRYFLREEVPIDMPDIERWMEETRLTCEEILRVERYGKDRLYRADPSICQNQFMKRCVYWPLCYGDYETAIADFVKRGAHQELAEED